MAPQDRVKSSLHSNYYIACYKFNKYKLQIDFNPAVSIDLGVKIIINSRTQLRTK